MPSPARRRALLAGLGALALALWIGPRAAADPGGQVPNRDASASHHEPDHGNQGDQGCPAPGQEGDRGTARCDREQPQAPPAAEPEPPTDADDGGAAPSPPPPTPTTSPQPSAVAPSPAEASPSSLTGAAAPPPASTAPGPETAPVASPPTPDPASAGGGASLETATVPLLDGTPVDLLPSSDRRQGDDIAPLLWILVPLVFVAGVAVGATVWALRPLVSPPGPPT